MNRPNGNLKNDDSDEYAPPDHPFGSPEVTRTSAGTLVTPPSPLRRMCRCSDSTDDLILPFLEEGGGVTAVYEERVSSTGGGGGSWTCTVCLNWNTFLPTRVSSNLTLSSLDEVWSASSPTGGEPFVLAPKKKKARTGEVVVDNADAASVDWAFLELFLSDEDLVHPDSTMQNNEATIQQDGVECIEQEQEEDEDQGVTNHEPVFRPTDVLFGRGGYTNQHPGNIAFRTLMAQFGPQYRAAENRTQKSAIAEQLLHHVLVVEDRRFYQEDKATQLWHMVDDQDDVTYKRLLEKVKQKLRES